MIALLYRSNGRLASIAAHRRISTDKSIAGFAAAYYRDSLSCVRPLECLSQPLVGATGSWLDYVKLF
jgi:hypothetical protein